MASIPLAVYGEAHTRATAGGIAIAIVLQWYGNYTIGGLWQWYGNGMAIALFRAAEAIAGWRCRGGFNG